MVQLEVEGGCSTLAWRDVRCGAGARTPQSRTTGNYPRAAPACKPGGPTPWASCHSTTEWLTRRSKENFVSARTSFSAKYQPVCSENVRALPPRRRTCSEVRPCLMKISQITRRSHTTWCARLNACSRLCVDCAVHLAEVPIRGLNHSASFHVTADLGS